MELWIYNSINLKRSNGCRNSNSEPISNCRCFKIDVFDPSTVLRYADDPNFNMWMNKYGVQSAYRLTVDAYTPDSDD